MQHLTPKLKHFSPYSAATPDWHPASSDLNFFLPFSLLFLYLLNFHQILFCFTHGPFLKILHSLNIIIISYTVVGKKMTKLWFLNLKSCLRSYLHNLTEVSKDESLLKNLALLCELLFQDSLISIN